MKYLIYTDNSNRGSVLSQLLGKQNLGLSRRKQMNQDNKISTEITLSVIIPAYNEEEGISEFHKRLSASLDKADDKQPPHVTR